MTGFVGLNPFCRAALAMTDKQTSYQFAVRLARKNNRMHTQLLSPQDATGLLSLIGLVALFVGLVLLVRRIQHRRKKESETIPSSAAKPFPQAGFYLQLLPYFKQADLRERQVVLRQAYEEWQTNFLLRGLDGQTEFLRGETHKRGLRYQLTSTSLTQALALFIRVQMARDGDDSRGSFERLLAHLLRHPALDHPALSSWLSMPDLPTSPRLEPDLHAEVWILASLLAAKTQWGSLERFNLEDVFQERSQALLDALNSQYEDQSRVFSPLLLHVIAQQLPNPLWKTQTEADWQALKPLLREEKGLPGRQQALSLLQIGLEGLIFPDNGFAERSDPAFLRLKRALASQEPLEGELEEGFSRLASLSCYVPLALLYKNGEFADQLWSRVSQAQPAKQDALGASMRLLAMMSMTGTLWLEKNKAEPTPITSE